MIVKDKDPALNYERLVRFAFDCGRYDDPLGLAHADTYDGNYESAGFRIKLGLSYALFKIGKNMDNQKFKELSEEALSADSQQKLTEIMDQAIDTVNG